MSMEGTQAPDLEDLAEAALAQQAQQQVALRQHRVVLEAAAVFVLQPLKVPATTRAALAALLEPQLPDRQQACWRISRAMTAPQPSLH